MVPRKGIEMITEITLTMPAGKYYLGDPCYSVPKDRWMEWLKAADYENAGCVLIADLEGRKVIGFGTAYGDGVYADQFGNTYGVDAGLIGLVPVEIAENPYGGREGCGRIVEFPEPFECSRYKNGTLKFGDIVIVTDV
jgi:hypothetical protein